MIAVGQLSEVNLATVNCGDPVADTAERSWPVRSEAIYVALGLVAYLEGKITATVVDVDGLHQLCQRSQFVHVLETILVLVSGHKERIGKDFWEPTFVHQRA